MANQKCFKRFWLKALFPDFYLDVSLNFTLNILKESYQDYSQNNEDHFNVTSR